MEDVFEDSEDIDEYSPDEYFPKKMITLNDCKSYESTLKGKLVEFNKTDPEGVLSLIHI